MKSHVKTTEHKKRDTFSHTERVSEIFILVSSYYYACFFNTNGAQMETSAEVLDNDTQLQILSYNSSLPLLFPF